MATRKSKSKVKHGEWVDGAFDAMPRMVARSSVVRDLSDAAFRLLHTALGLHTGANNGHLCLTLSALSSYGWTSNRKLAAAKNQLLEVGLLVQTRQGGLGIGPSLYALGWLGISRWDGLDISLVQFQKHRGRWKSNGATAAPGAGSGAVPKGDQFPAPGAGTAKRFPAPGAGSAKHPERVQPAPGAGTAKRFPAPGAGSETAQKTQSLHPERVTGIPGAIPGTACDVPDVDVGGMLG
ncbi:MAG: hypothetical protein AABZ79_25310 [Pseudomonadota bacterium]|jgi:hypothetical protein|uniref:Helix-turn-helix domain-containing protein n=1 Tax=Cupriavidus metallidurans TaxID=119219 RepID=A0A482IVA6_9BURK|nr:MULTISPECIES: hypothetical protein [Cupriavidus]QBP12301.1 hypothetical protein DDF84_021355 [Cupriavidus metallidurans]